MGAHGRVAYRLLRAHSCAEYRRGTRSVGHDTHRPLPDETPRGQGYTVVVSEHVGSTK